VADVPGVTRDRQYGISRVGQRPCLLVDTGGLVSQAEGIDYLTAGQVHQAIDEAHLVLFVVSARDGLTAEDEEIAALLRRASKEVLLIANKVDGMDESTAAVEFTRLGMGEAQLVTASHQRGLDAMMKAVDRHLPEARQEAVIGLHNWQSHLPPQLEIAQRNSGLVGVRRAGILVDEDPQLGANGLHVGGLRGNLYLLKPDGGPFRKLVPVVLVVECRGHYEDECDTPCEHRPAVSLGPGGGLENPLGHMILGIDMLRPLRAGHLLGHISPEHLSERRMQRLGETV